MKQWLSETWTARAQLFFFANGIKQLVQRPRAIIITAIYWTIVLLLRWWIIKDNDTLEWAARLSNTGNAGLLIVIASAIFIVFVFALGKPKGAGQMMRDSMRAGLVNHAGETPLLMEQRIDENEVFTLVFRNFGIPLSHWNDHKEDIESGLNLNITDICERGKKYMVVTAVSGANILPNFVEWKDALLPTDNFVLGLGETYTGQVRVNLAITPHMLIGGSTGSGKSILLKCLLMQCVKKGAEVYIADFKGGVDFPRVWHEKCTFITERADLIEKLKQLITELHARKTMFSDMDYANIDEYNKQGYNRLRRIIFACDEVAELLDKTGLDKKQKDEISQIEASIATIARLGRAFGIHLILATQRPDANIISGQIKNNIDYRVCGRADDVLSQIILDKTDASDQISKSAQGRFLTNSDILFQGYWFDDSSFEGEKEYGFEYHFLGD